MAALRATSLVMKIYLRDLPSLASLLVRRTLQRRRANAAPRRIFIDCGSNTCEVLMSHMKALPNFEFYAFEPQPELAHAADKARGAFPKIPLQFFPQAVWVRNEVLNFFLATHSGRNFKGGSTLVEGHTQNSAKVDYQHPVEVAAIDFSQWIRTNFSADDYIIVKMDIEGAEYPVLEKMATDGTLAMVDEFVVEFHQHMSEEINRERHDALIAQLRASALLQIWR